MGFVRLLLALSIVLFHLGTYNSAIIDQVTAVNSFFIISGFYMALILDKKYSLKNEGILLFFSNRFLKIYPLYWLVLLLTFFLTCVKFFWLDSSDNAISHYLQYSEHLQFWPLIIQTINFIIRNITLIITTDYVLPVDYTPGYLLVQQAWTLQIEVLFYLMAPFLVNLKNNTFISFFFLYVGIVFGLLIPTNIVASPSLMYTFFTCSIYFLLGIVSHKFIFKYLMNKVVNKKYLLITFILFVLYLLMYGLIQTKLPITWLHITDVYYYVLFTLIIPFIFLATKDSKVDRFLGEFSYPIYIIHFLIIKVFSNISFLKNNSEINILLTILLTLSISYVLIIFFIHPIDIYRQSRLRS